MINNNNNIADLLNVDSYYFLLKNGVILENDHILSYEALSKYFSMPVIRVKGVKVMKTKLLEEEINFYNGLIKNYNSLKDESFLERIYFAESILGKSLNQIDFYFDYKEKLDFLTDALLLYKSLDGIIVGKIDKFFWFLDEYGDIYLISKNIEDIANQMLNLFSGLDVNQDPKLESFYYINETKYGESFNDLINDFKVFSKQYGYDFDLMKDINDYDGIEEDIEEFNKILASYGIVNEED